MRRRNKVVVLLTMPIAVFFWTIGWVMAYFGSKQRPITHKVKVAKHEELTLTVLAPEPIIPNLKTHIKS